SGKSELETDRRTANDGKQEPADSAQGHLVGVGVPGSLLSLDRVIRAALQCASVRRPTADLLLLVTVSLWALNFTVSKYILDHGFRPLAYSSTRYACAALIFAAITLFWEGSLRMG